MCICFNDEKFISTKSDIAIKDLEFVHAHTSMFLCSFFFHKGSVKYNVFYYPKLAYSINVVYFLL